MKKVFTVGILLLVAFSILSGQTYTISGRIIENKGETPVLGANLVLMPEGRHTTTDNLGQYSFRTGAGAKQLIARSLGFESVILKFDLKSDTLIDLSMNVTVFELDEVNVIGNSANVIQRTNLGSFIVTPSAMREIPKLFGEPDLLKSLQILPGVSFGKEGSSDIYVRGGGAGQNVIFADGCSFFLPGHLLGIVSPIDLDFLESAELYKDYIPSDIGGGASSVISLDFLKPHTDSLTTQLRLGLISSGVILEVPFKKINLDLTAGIKSGNYFLYSKFLKKIIPDDVGNFLPPDKYSFFDSFFKLSYESTRAGKISYLFFGNYDNGTDESKTYGTHGDTLVKYTEGLKTGWNSMVQALEWEPSVRDQYKWIFNLNYNRLATGRRLYSESESLVNSTGEEISFSDTNYSFYPAINNIGFSSTVKRDFNKISVSLGVSDRFRSYVPNNYALITKNDTVTRNSLSGNSQANEISLFTSTNMRVGKHLQIDVGLRLTSVLIRNGSFFTAEPRLSITYGQGSKVSPHINFVRLGQNDHAVEGSNAGLRSQLWLPLYKDFGPEISDVLSAGFKGEIRNDLTWNLDGYIKRTTGMLDYKPGASFIFDTSFVDMVERTTLRAYGIEAGFIKKSGRLTGSASYTWSRSKREWPSPEGLIWIPSVADRPHNLNLSLKYHYNEKTSLGLNFVYQSGAPATIYMHETSYGEFFETKNNIRYFDYHRLDFSFRHLIRKPKFSFWIDAGIYNVYNRRNTFYFKKIWDEAEGSYLYKNISLYPIMPSIALTFNF